MANPDRPSVPPNRRPDRLRTNFLRYRAAQGFIPSESADDQGVEPDLRKTPERPTLVSMEPASKDYVDLKLDAALAPILAKLDSIEKNQLSPKQLWTAAGTTIAAVAGIVVAVLAIGGDRFDGGMAASGVISSMTQEQQARDRAQDEKLDSVISRLDALLDAQATPTAPAPESPTE